MSTNYTPYKTTKHFFGYPSIKLAAQKSPYLRPNNVKSQDIYSICANLLEAFLNKTQIDVDNCIDKIDDKQLKQKFSSFKQEYYYLIFIQNKLKLKVSELSDLIKMITTSKELILPTLNLKNEIKELDYPSLQKVIKMTNQSKIYSQIMKKEEVKLNIDYFNPQSMANFNSLIQMQSENFQEVKSLKIKLSEKEKKESVNLELASNRENIVKLKVEIDRLTKENRALKEQQIKEHSSFYEKNNFRRNSLQDLRLSTRSFKNTNVLQPKQYQQILDQKQRKINQLTDNLRITRLMFDQARTDRDEAKDISKAIQMQFQELNEKYNKVVRENKEKEQKYKECLEQVQMNILLEKQIRSKDQRLKKALQQLQQNKISQSIEKERAALLKSQQMKQETRKKAFKQMKMILRKQLYEKSAIIKRREQELKNAILSYEIQVEQALVKQEDELLDVLSEKSARQYRLSFDKLLQLNNRLREQNAQLHKKFNIKVSDIPAPLPQEEQQSFSDLTTKQIHASSIK